MDRALVQFLEVADKGNISRAAASLSVTQPTLTFNLKKLEQNLGVELFERSSRGVVLTTYGETLYEHATLMRRLYANALAAIERQKLLRQERLSIGTGYSWWELLLKPIVMDYCATHPEFPVNVSLGSTLRCMDQLLAGDIVFFIGHRIEALARGMRVDFIQLGMIRDGYFSRDGHPLLGARRSMQEVLSYPSAEAFPSEARHQRLLLEAEAIGRPGELPDYVAFTSDSLEACLEYVASSNAVLKHTDLMAPIFRAKGFQMVDVLAGEVPPKQAVGIYILPERRSDQRIAELIELIQDKSRLVISPR
ncbi:LysR family transcriptional regulator [Pararhizobium sp. LjRoot255]|uniref:LysR family transcriptional regulator n=1 Tax=Pararhizobium sp. LjRoot255 TaxID=3342298 RepID=UPI003ECCC22B